MIRYLLSQGFWLVLLIAMQVLIFNQVGLFYNLHPYVYILFILWLPGMLPAWSMLLVSFIVGLVIDAFMYTYGLHAGACTLAAIVRIYGMPWLLSAEDMAQQPVVRIPSIGLRRFIVLMLAIVSVHHAYLLFLEVFTFQHFFQTALKTLLNVFLTSIVLFSIEGIRFYPSGSKRI